MEKTTLSRRSFLTLLGAAAGSASLAACGAPAGLDGQFGQLCRSQIGTGRILVAYASKYGSTQAVAEAIGARLCARGEAVDIAPAAGVKDLGPYRAVAVGSAVYMGKWMGPALKLLESRATMLARVPVAFFTVHMLALDDTQKSAEERAKYTEAARAAVIPQAEVFFAGRLDMSKMSLVDKTMAKALDPNSRDLRDWDAIDVWAEKLFLA